MKKIYLLLPLLFICTLTSCKSHKIQSSGVVECYSISINDSNSLYNSDTYTYSKGYSEVYEYKDSNSNKIYSNFANSNNTNTKINLHNSNISGDYTEYSYVSLIGYLTIEYNYYLDLDNLIIDCETKFSKYQNDINPITTNVDNDNAYKLASSKYYYTTTSSSYSTIDIYKDQCETSLTRHTYIKLNDNYTISYKLKY